MLQVIRKFDPQAEVKILSPQKAEVSVEESVIPRIIGKGGAQVKELEEMLSIHIDVKPRGSQGLSSRESSELEFELKDKGGSIDLLFRSQDAGKKVGVYSEDDMLFETTISKKGVIGVPQKSESGKKILRAMRNGGRVKVFED